MNIEGISKAKCDVPSKILHDEMIQILLLQETHTKDNQDIESRGIIEGFTLVNAVHSPVHGIASYIKDNIVDYESVYAGCDDGVQVIAMKICSVTIVNVYRPPSVSRPDKILTAYPHPCVFMGDFHSHHSDWGYQRSDYAGTVLSDWMSNNGLSLIFDAKIRKSFHSNVHGTETNPDLCFVSASFHENNAAKVYVLNDFPRSQHRPLTLDLGSTIHICQSTYKPRWNFLKANWEGFSDEMEHVIQFIPPVIENYQRFVDLVKSIGKKHVPRGSDNVTSLVGIEILKNSMMNSKLQETTTLPINY